MPAAVPAGARGLGADTPGAEGSAVALALGRGIAGAVGAAAVGIGRAASAAGALGCSSGALDSKPDVFTVSAP
jgi:hypothetical protein